MEGPTVKVPLPIRMIPAFAERAWFTPPPLSGRREERWRESLAGTEPLVLTVDGFDLSGFTLGAGPLVLLVHGWGGRASQMSLLAKAIAERGFTVVAVDAPGHGDGRSTSDIFQMTAAIESLVDRFGQPTAVVAHSLGSMATVRALRTQMPGSLVLLAPLLDVEVALAKFIERAQLAPWTARSLVRRIKRFVGAEWDSFVVGYRTDFGDADVFVVHDPDDADAPFEVSAALAATRERTVLWIAESTGHTGLLQDSEVLEKVANHLVEAFTADSRR
jgi:pimeloyl-ACP methyl ester carboxylesterase